jgi:Peptidase MA superfamily
MRRRPTARAFVALGVAFAASWSATATVRAATPDFGRPTIDGSFGAEIVAMQPVTFDVAPDLVEVLVTTSDGPPLVAEAASPGAGATTLRYSVGGGDGHILPNTPVSVRWRITADGVTTVSPVARTVVDDERFDWQTLRGDVVRVHWYEGGRAFGERALGIGERAVEETARKFGVTEKDPVDFFIYADNEAFYDALGPGTRENVGGQANADIRTLFAHIGPGSIDDPWVENVVPHELIHLVFDTAVKNPYHFPPRWLNEGLAVYLSVGYEASDRSSVEAAAKAGNLIPLDGLAGQFPTSASRFGLAYAESASAVDFLVRTHGEDTMVSLVRSYAEGRTDDEAFEAAIGMDVAAFNDAWLADLGAKEPVRYGPQPPPAGPIPAGWGDASPVPGDVGTPRPTASQPPTASRTAPLDTDPLGPIWLWVLGVIVAGGVVLTLRARSHRRSS